MMHELTIKQDETRTLVLHTLADDASQWDILQEEGSTLTVQLIVLDGQSGNATIRVRQTGQHCTTRIYGLGLLKGQQQVSIETYIEHAVAYGTSEQVLKFVLDDQAQGAFYGLVKVNKNAQKTDARQTNRNIILSPKAAMRTRPQLEIYADDVQCSHGASTGQLDESALFYMMQRGIAPDIARRMLLSAFFHDVLSTLEDKTLRKNIEEQININL